MITTRDMIASRRPALDPYITVEPGESLDVMGTASILWTRIVVRPPPGINTTYKPRYNRTSKQRGLAKSKEATQWTEMVRQLLAVAGYGHRGLQRWDAPYAVHIALFNSKFDVDAHLKLILDAPQGYLYPDDRAIKHVAIDVPPPDDGPERLEISVAAVPEGMKWRLTR